MVTKKSILMIIVVFALTSLAEGGFQIGTRYLDGTPFEPDTDVLLLDESLYLSIYTDVWEYSLWTGYFWALVCDCSLASITEGEAGPDAYIVTFHGSASDLWSIPGSVPEGEDGRVGTIAYDYEPRYPPGLYLDNFLYTPLSVGDVPVRFLDLDPDSGVIMDVEDSIIIHQIPEPMTIILVCLGGLFVLRRR